MTFNIIVEGNGKRKVYNSRIVGLSGKINSILVPEDFLLWANREFGTADKGHSSRLLVEFTDASDERIPQYFETNGLNINKVELESSKIAFFFRLAILFVLTIAIVIIVLATAFIALSMNLVVQRNRDMVRNLYNIGFSVSDLSRFYQRTVAIVTVASAAIAMAVVMLARNQYVGRLATLFDIGSNTATTLLCTLFLTVAVLAFCILFIRRNIKTTCITE